MITEAAHAARDERSKGNLAKAVEAAEKNGYDLKKTREDIERLFEERFKKKPYQWQMDVTEAMIVGLDSFVIAGTGSGKTMPFMMPLLTDKRKKAIIISPLKLLQEDHARRCKELGISAVAVNGDTWSSTLLQELEAGVHQVILTSPEMCIKHSQFRSFLSSATEAKEVMMVVIDEAHCISQAFFPVSTPFLVTSATLTPATIRDIQGQLNIDIDEGYFLNLGNDRPNITMSTQTISTAKDYDALLPLLTRGNTLPVGGTHDVIKTIIFMNSIPNTQQCARHIKSRLPPELHRFVDVMHAIQRPKTKRRVMNDFRCGRIKILIATEAAGMGADIPDIEQVIQLGVPPSLSVWIQRAGRAGRSPEINARAILLVERSVFQCRKAKTKDPDLVLDDVSSNESGDNDPLLRPKDGWMKNVDPHLRRWIETDECRRDVLDRYFGNPPGRKPPTHGCCDNCLNACDEPLSIPRPLTPSNASEEPANTTHHLSPSKKRNANGKRAMETAAPVRRSKEHLQAVKESLIAWRLNTKLNKYSPSSILASSIPPDKILNKLASTPQIDTLDMLVKEAGCAWMLGARHFEEVKDRVSQLDQAHKADIEQKKRQKRLETETRQAEALRKKKAEQWLKDQQKEWKKKQTAEKNEAKRQEQEEKREEKRRSKLAPTTPASIRMNTWSSSPLPAQANSGSMFGVFEVRDL
ncbi:P-loop containing nucleoside triphosphate hydrolase protein [Coprinopsis sp. MPI-PUGE-AT-0042]|nr:P-loop containing nucleoside triphosphate hydrolase protein [Coprinopsis sp. MPI-PUGE-AT-0042]